MAASLRTGGINLRKPTGIRAVYIVGIALILIIFLAQEFHVRNFIIDDTFITYTFARNVAEGNGPVFNPGERVEGYSNFLWMLMLAGSFSLGFDPIYTSKALGVIFSSTSVVLTYLISLELFARYSSRRLLSVIAPLLLAISVPFILWSISGLETSLYSFLITSAIYATLRESQNPSRRPWSALFCALLAMTRIEGAAIAGVIFAIRWLNAYRQHGKGPAASYQPWPLRRVAIWLCVFLVPLVVWNVWRLSYYGWLLPNTYYAKMGGPSHLLDGVVYIGAFGTSITGGRVGLVAVGAVIILGIYLAWRSGVMRFGLVLLLGVIGVHAALVIYSGGDWMPYYRFIVPVLPAVFLLVAVAISGLFSAPPRFSGIARFVGVIVLGLLLFQSGRAVLSDLPSALKLADTTYSWAEIGRQLRDRYPENTRIAQVSAGAIMYESRFRLIDLVGLQDVTVAHLPGDPTLAGKFAPVEYVASQNPDLVILFTYKDPHEGCCTSFIPGMSQLYNSQYFQNHYKMVDDYPFQEIGGLPAWLVLYERVAASS